MTSDITGLHHMSALAGTAAGNLRFYTRTLGLRLVKRTVNFDAPGSWHLYYGDRTGRPGSLVTFFPHPGYRAGVPGAGEVAITHLAAGPGSLAFWQDRLAAAGVEVARQSAGGKDRLRFRDPDGTRLTLAEADAAATDPAPAADVPAEKAILGLSAVTIVVSQLDPTAAFLTDTLGFKPLGQAGNRAWFEPTGVPLVNAVGRQSIEVVADANAPRPVLGVGSVHHVAWRVPDDAAQARVRALVEGKVTGLTETKDRSYFRSIYFREPGGTIFEVATDGPGFPVDEPVESLGTTLKLPPQFEPRRHEIEAILPPLT
ncbi:MAG TPA: ring-cleaving dioxygenase [Humisphaera sp.]